MPGFQPAANSYSRPQAASSAPIDPRSVIRDPRPFHPFHRPSADGILAMMPLDPFDRLLGESAQARAMRAFGRRAASVSATVLLTGETGTGKEVVARLIHTWSPRRAKQFVPINCAAIPNELMEAELFGYARGAVSGAVHAYDGLLMAAEGGTVFLDEIDDTPLPVQVKLLRVLEDRTVSRLGESSWRQVDFRVVAATNRDLRPLIAEGRFGAPTLVVGAHYDSCLDSPGANDNATGTAAIIELAPGIF